MCTEHTSWSVPQHTFLVSTHCALRGSRQSCVRAIHGHPAGAFSSCVFDVVAQHQVHSIPVAPLFTQCFLIQGSNVTSGPHKKLVSMPRRTRSLEGVWPPGRFRSKHRGYEPNLADFSNYTDPEHNPIDIPNNNPDFLCSDDVTMISSSGMPNSEALSSSCKAAASKVFVFVRSYELTGNWSRSCVKSF